MTSLFSLILLTFIRLVIVWYFAITTLSTVGFGDFYPISTEEKIVTAFIMLIGVSVFSFMVGNLI